MSIQCAALLIVLLVLGAQGMGCKAQSAQLVATELNRTCDRIRTDIEGKKGLIKELPDSNLAEGGEATAFNGPSGICYMHVVWYGETGRNEVEYYFEDDSLFFAQDRHVEYNRPIYWDKEHAETNGDTVVFDASLSRVEENRYYFEHHRLILWLGPDNKAVDLTLGTNTLVGQGLIGHAYIARQAFE